MRRYRLVPMRRILNASVKPLIRLGLAGGQTYLLTVAGRKTGRPYSTPVRLIENDQRWLVAPYGEVGWVRNARAAAAVQLSRAGRSERVGLSEAAPQEAEPVLREYLEQVAVARPFFGVATNSPDSEFVAEAPLHPVFRISADASLETGAACA